MNINKYERLPGTNNFLRYNNEQNYKWVYFFIINVCFFYYFCFYLKNANGNDEDISKIQLYKSKLIEENFFVFDSNNLENIKPHMYGYCLSKDGFLTDNYYKKLGYYKEPDSLGAYIMIRRNESSIIINQDYYGSFGLYIYKDNYSNYFALSNSFLLLEEYLIDKKNISLNRDFSDNFIITWLCTPSIYETMINEIRRLPSNVFIVINTTNKKFEINYIDYEENTIPLESEKGLKIIDEWVDKWTYIIRSLKKQTDNIYFDLTGGFDSRAVLSIFLNSGIDSNEMSFNSLQINVNGHDEDLMISKNISSKFGFELNKFNLDKNYTKWSPKETLFCSMYTKLGIHKEFYLERGFLTKPRIAFTGGGGDFIKGGPAIPIQKFIEMLSSGSKGIIDHQVDFYNSSVRLCQRSLNLVKKGNTLFNEYEISSIFNQKFNANHFGKKTVEGYMANLYFIQPLIDPDLSKIKYNISGELSHDLIAYIYVRFAHDLIDFPFQGNRILNPESIKKAEKLNKILQTYKIKIDYNQNFYLDNQRTSPIPQTNNFKLAEEYLENLFKSSYFIDIINRAYDNNVYNWTNEFSEKSNFFSFRHLYGLLSVAMTFENLSLNEKYMKQIKFIKCLGEDYNIMKYLMNIKD